MLAIVVTCSYLVNFIEKKKVKKESGSQKKTFCFKSKKSLIILMMTYCLVVVIYCTIVKFYLIMCTNH